MIEGAAVIVEIMSLDELHGKDYKPEAFCAFFPLFVLTRCWV